MFEAHSSLYFYTYLLILGIVLLIYKIRGYFTLTPANLYGQPLFGLCLLGPIFSSVYFGIPVWTQTTLLMSAAGYQHFYEISKIPLLLLAAAVPTTAIIVSLHRTVQVEKQIATAEFKNTMDEFYSHNKHIVEAFAKIESPKVNFIKAQLHCLQEGKSWSIKRPHALYKRIYPQSTPETGAVYQPAESFTKGTLNRFQALEKALLDLSEEVLDRVGANKPTKSDKELFTTIRNNLHRIARLFEFQERPGDIDLIHFKANTLNHPEITHIIYEIRAYYMLFHKVCVDVLDAVGITAATDKELYQTFKNIFRHGKNLEDYVVKGTPLPKPDAQS